MGSEINLQTRVEEQLQTNYLEFIGQKTGINQQHGNRDSIPEGIKHLQQNVKYYTTFTFKYFWVIIKFTSKVSFVQINRQRKLYWYHFAKVIWNTPRKNTVSNALATLLVPLPK